MNYFIQGREPDREKWNERWTFEMTLYKPLYDLDSICYRNGFEICNFSLHSAWKEVKQ
jgi:hypothetical protein